MKKSTRELLENGGCVVLEPDDTDSKAAIVHFESWIVKVYLAQSTVHRWAKQGKIVRSDRYKSMIVYTLPGQTLDKNGPHNENRG